MGNRFSHVDMTGFDRKMKRMQSGMSNLLKQLIRDAATYLNAKVVDDTLSGPEGENYPKSGYPGGISPGSTGFVGVVSGELKRSIQIQKINDLEYFVLSDQIIAPYNRDVDDWATEKYGSGFFDIAVILYSQSMLQLFGKEVERYVNHVTRDIPYTYTNPYPV